MNNRKTSAWTETLQEAYGDSGEKGDVGERFVTNELIERGISVKISQDHYKMQTSGVDIYAVVGNYIFSADVKNNVKPNGNFPIYFNWLFDSEKISEYLIHVNPKTGKMYWYLRDEAKKYLNGLRNTKQFVWYEPGSRFPFVREGWDSLIEHVKRKVDSLLTL